jgi:competence protein ComEA
VPSVGGIPAISTTGLDLNRASAAELETLPGIGPSLASAIIQYREQNGPFQSVEGLLSVPGIGPTRLSQLRPLVRVD